jgi:hypothetical protein
MINRRILKIIRHPWFHLGCVLIIYGILLVPTIRRQGISWDEQTDISITRSYLEKPDGFLAGSHLDPSQTRLPMFCVAFVYLLFNTSDLIVARLISCIVGGLTLIGIYVYCKQRYDHARGILACSLLATSPFFLSFARVAFTETDVYLACILAWLLVCMSRLQDHPTIGRATIVSILLGLSISAKFLALAVIPAVGFVILERDHRNQNAGLPKAHTLTILSWIAWIFISTYAGWWVVFHLSPKTYVGSLRSAHYALVLLAWLLPLVWLTRHRQQTTSPVAMVGLISGLALLTFFVVPPEHLTNPDILRSLSTRFRGEMSYDPGYMFEAFALHTLSILFKSSLVIGAGLLLALMSMRLQWRRREIHFAVLVTLGYFAGLIVLPVAQTFYTIPLLPVLAVFASDLFFRLYSRRRAAAVGLSILAVGLLGLDMSLCYPDYNLDGYQWLGARPLAGESSISYRSVVQTPSDGVQQAFEWLNTHARAGERVLAYVAPWHIIQATAPNPIYRIENGFKGTIRSRPDYVVVHINELIWNGWGTDTPRGNVFRYPFDRTWLEANYIKVFSVPRAFGIEMASVWHIKEAH